MQEDTKGPFHNIIQEMQTYYSYMYHCQKEKKTKRKQPKIHER